MKKILIFWTKRGFADFNFVLKSTAPDIISMKLCNYSTKKCN